LSAEKIELSEFDTLVGQAINFFSDIDTAAVIYQSQLLDFCLQAQPLAVQNPDNSGSYLVLQQ